MRARDYRANGASFFPRKDTDPGPCPPRFRRSPRRNTRRCRPSRACASRPPRPASSTRTAPTCWPWCSTRAPQAAGVFTRSKCPSAPVDLCRAEPGRRHRRASWSSIPATPMPSPARRAARRRARPAKAAAKAAACGEGEVFLASTGVIGEPLDAGRFTHLLADMVQRRQGRGLDRGRQRDHDHRHLSEGRDRHGRSSAAST